MKKNLTLWAVVFTLFAIEACQKAEMSANGNAKGIVGENSAKGGGVSTTTYGGQAAGLNATVVSTGVTGITSYQTILSQTPVLSAQGGALSTNSLLANIPNVFTADSLGATISGQGSTASAQSAASNLSVTVGGHLVTASYVQSDARVNCGPVFTGSSVIQNLVIDGKTIIVTGAANQVVFFPSGGFVIINEQSTSKKAGLGTITVTALRVTLPNGTAIRVAVSKADIKC